MDGLFTVFVDNLPKSMDVAWLHQLFSPFGCVKDVYMPSKRSSSFNTKFGFVRFKRRDEAAGAIEDLNGALIRDYNIVVQFAKYSKDSPSVSWKKLDEVRKVNMASPMHVMNDSVIRKGDISRDFRNLRAHKSFAAAVANGKPYSPARFSIHARLSGVDWLNRSAVGKLPSWRNVDLLRDAFIADGVTNIQLRGMGGNLILLAFASVEDMHAMLEEAGLCWLSNWFSEVKQWSPNLKFENKRIVWLSCYGVPLHLWNVDTFFSIGNSWGVSITLDDDTSNGESFSVGKVQVLTGTFAAINQKIELIHNGISYPVRVVEEQGVGNVFMKAYCVCRGHPIRRTEEEVSASDSKIQVDEGAQLDSKEEEDVEAIEGQHRDLCSLQHNVVDKQRKLNIGNKSQVSKLSAEVQLSDAVGAFNEENSNGTPGLESMVEDSLGPLITDRRIQEDFNSGSSKHVAQNIEAQEGEGTNWIVQDSGLEESIIGPVTIGSNDELRASQLEGINLQVDLRPKEMRRIIRNETMDRCSNSQDSEYNVAIHNVVGPPFNPNEPNVEGQNLDLVEDNHVPIQAAIKGIKGKKKRKNIDEILGLTKINMGNQKGGRNKNKCAVYRSASAAVALSVSTEGIANRNRILLNEAQAVWALDNLFGNDYAGSEEEVISKIIQMEVQDEERAAMQAKLRATAA